MSETAEIQNLDTLGAAFFPVLHHVKTERRRKLFHRYREIRTDSIRMRHQRSSARGNTESRHLGNSRGGLSYYLSIQRPARRLDSLFQLCLFLRTADVRSLFSQFLEDRILHRVVANDGLFR